MSLISPTTLFVTGSISMTLSPAALVWMIRTVAACRVRPAHRRTAISREHLVFIAQHSKLRSHGADLLFAAVWRHGAGRGAAALHARLRVLQNQSAAAPRRKAAGARAVRDVPLPKHGVPAAAAACRPDGLHRRGVAQ